LPSTPGGIAMGEPRNPLESPPDYVLVSRAKLEQLVQRLATREVMYFLVRQLVLIWQIFDVSVTFDDGIATVSTTDELDSFVWTSSPKIGLRYEINMLVPCATALCGLATSPTYQFLTLLGIGAQSLTTWYRIQVDTAAPVVRAELERLMERN